MAKTKIDRIDQLFQSSAALPLGPENATGQEAAVRIIQELLICQGYTGLPNARAVSGYGRFGPVTLKKLKDFRVKNGLQKFNEPVVLDHFTLHRLAEAKANSARASRGYIALALDIEITGLIQVLTFITLVEAEGPGLKGFSAFNQNTDHQGLSYGIIQWAQKPRRLRDIVEMYQTGNPVLFDSIFGDQAASMVAHTQKKRGGVDQETGKTTDEKFDLVDQLWKNRFVKAAENKIFQKIQVKTAIVAFQIFIEDLRTYGDKIHSQRGYAFMIDLANQHRDPKGIYKKVVTDDMSEADALVKITAESVRIVRKNYPPPTGKDKSNEEIATQDRRDFFRTTSLLSDEIFDEN